MWVYSYRRKKLLKKGSQILDVDSDCGDALPVSYISAHRPILVLSRPTARLIDHHTPIQVTLVPGSIRALFGSTRRVVWVSCTVLTAPCMGLHPLQSRDALFLCIGKGLGSVIL